MSALAQPVLNDELLGRAVQATFDPKHGSPFWLDRARRYGLNGLRDLRCMEDLKRFGPLHCAEIAHCPIDQFVPAFVREQLQRYCPVQTGGTTGSGAWTVYANEMFTEQFVHPFDAAARLVGFPRGERWLFVGPSGPHIICKAARAIAQAMNSPEPFAIDFDPKWVRKLEAGSFARQRYTSHLIEQCLDVLRSTPIGVLFITPPLALALADAMTEEQRHAIHGVHYGGMRLTQEVLDDLQQRAFPNAVHLSGYGNSLLGCSLELDTSLGRTPTYFPFGSAVRYELVDENMKAVEAGDVGRVCATRLDPAYFLCNLLERDQASFADLPDDAPAGFSQPGLIDPRPIDNRALPLAAGLY
jgi:hypothetical protein